MPATIDSASAPGVIRRCDQIMRALEKHGDLSVRDLASFTGEPRTTVYRLLGQLRDVGLVELGPRYGTFRLGLRVLSMAAAVQARLSLYEAAGPALARLRVITEESVFLCERRGDEVICIDRIEGSKVRVLALVLGGSLPLYAGAASRAVLAHLPAGEFDDYLLRPRPHLTDQSTVEADAIRADVEQIRATGIAVSDGDVTEGVAALGSAVFDRLGCVVGAISIAGVRPAILGSNQSVLAEAVRAAASDVSRELGYESDGG